jgi:hypothetical protein
MVFVCPFLTTAAQVRYLRISVPLIEPLLDGVRYFREGDLPPAAGEELRPIARPKLGGHWSPTISARKRRGPWSTAA